MFTNLTITNFRCFKEVAIDGLERVNLIIGKNDAGKTALLEAIYFLLGETNLTRCGRPWPTQPGASTCRLRDFLEALVRRPGFNRLTALGITRDADANAASALQSVCDALKASRLPVPQAVGRPVGGPPRRAVYILRGRGRKGMLEDLCLAAVASERGMECVKEFFQCVARKARRKPKNLSKARVHVSLASQKEPDLRLGEAAQKGYWPWDHAACAGVRRFLQSVFGVPRSHGDG